MAEGTQRKLEVILAADAAGTAGDGIMVEFGSAVAAVEYAGAVQQGMIELNAGPPDDRRVLLRVEVNIGEVIVDGEDIYGAGVNIAERQDDDRADDVLGDGWLVGTDGRGA